MSFTGSHVIENEQNLAPRPLVGAPVRDIAVNIYYKKVALFKIFEEVRNDCLSFTGSNLRQLMLLMDKDSIEDLEPTDIFENDFAMSPVQEAWRIPIVKEIIDLKTGEMVLPGDGLTSSQLEEILDTLITE